MRLDRFHSGRFSNFGQFCLFETDGTCRNKKISDPIGHNAYGAENGSLTRCSLWIVTVHGGRRDLVIAMPGSRKGTGISILNMCKLVTGAWKFSKRETVKLFACLSRTLNRHRAQWPRESNPQVVADFDASSEMVQG
jgi:hypothetical protein